MTETSERAYTTSEVLQILKENEVYEDEVGNLISAK